MNECHELDGIGQWAVTLLHANWNPFSFFLDLQEFPGTRRVHGGFRDIHGYGLGPASNRATDAVAEKQILLFWGPDARDATRDILGGGFPNEGGVRLTEVVSVPFRATSVRFRGEADLIFQEASKPTPNAIGERVADIHPGKHGRTLNCLYGP